jgi:hypothetical protein
MIFFFPTIYWMKRARSSHSGSQLSTQTFCSICCESSKNPEYLFSFRLEIEVQKTLMVANLLTISKLNSRYQSQKTVVLRNLEISRQEYYFGMLFL